MMRNIEINPYDMGVQLDNVGYNMANFISKRTGKTITQVLSEMSTGRIIATSDKLSFSAYLYRLSMGKLGVKKSKPIELADLLIWLDFTFMPYSENVLTFYQNKEVCYIYIGEEGDEKYGSRKFT